MIAVCIVVQDSSVYDSSVYDSSVYRGTRGCTYFEGRVAFLTLIPYSGYFSGG